MFYHPEQNDHGLPFAPLKACVVPRPIGWISTISRAGIVNLAPYSQFIILGFSPPYVGFSAKCRADGRRKDSVVNAEETGEFVYNMATWDLRAAVVATSADDGPEINEMMKAGLTAAASRVVAPPRVAESPVQFECKYYQTTVLPGSTSETNCYLVVGRVVGVHIADEVFTHDGRVDIARLRPLSRLGYMDYATVTDSFELLPDVEMHSGLLRSYAGG